MECCERPKRRPLIWILFAAALAIVAIAAFAGSSGTAPIPPAAMTDPLVVEFEGSYPSAVQATGNVREFSLRAAPTQLTMLDGRALDVWAYNGQVPGPTFRVRVGDTIRVRFTNDLPQPTTVHWHGVRVPNAMDGVPGVTQPAIEPGGTFTYEFVVPDAGTFWFHPHVRSSEQVERGLHGVLIVEDEAPPAFSRELVWVLDDWKLAEDGQISPAFNTPHDLSHDGRWGTLISVNGQQTPDVEVRPGERIRLRLLNVANGRVFKLDLGGLQARGIAFDGLYAREPFDPSALELSPGNRMDVDVMVPASSRGATLEISDHYTRKANLVARWAISREEPVATPDFASPAHGKVPSWSAASEVPVTKDLALNAQRGGPYGISWMIAGVPMQHDAHDHAAHSSFTLKRGAFSRLSFVNESARIHPMHLHGTFFKVITRDGKAVDEPFFRDTVLVRPRERVDIGLVPLDEGTWMMHCHILEHAESGMMTLFRVE